MRNAYEARHLRHVRPTWVALAAQLPVYAPSEAEARDPALFARNVRAYMVRARRLPRDIG